MPGLAVNVRVPRSVSGPNFLLPQSVFPATSELRRGTAATVFVVGCAKCAVRSVWVNGLEGDQVEIASDSAPVILSFTSHSTSGGRPRCCQELTV